MRKTIKHNLKKELDFFIRKKNRFLELYPGQFVLIKRDKLIGTYTTEQEAFKAGVEKFGSQPFLIKQVIKQEPIATHPSLLVGLINASSQ